MSEFGSLLTAVGMTAGAADRKQRLFGRACEALDWSRERDAGSFAVFVPGRVDVLGKHTDYAGGRSLLCAAERGICLVARPRRYDVLRVRDVVSGSSVSLSMFNPSQVAEAEPAGAAGWGLYAATVAARLARNFPAARLGADIAFGSDLPMAAGMSSSSALITALFLALAAVNGLPGSATWRANLAGREDLAEYLGTVENGQDFRALTGEAGGVGTCGGSEDHTAMLCCRAGELSQYSFCPVRYERQIPMPAGYVFAIASSGVVAEKTAGARDAYNRASASTREIVTRWNQATERRDTTLRAAVESGDDAADRIRALLTDAELRRRFEQFIEETFVIIPQVGDRLTAGQVTAIGELVDRSQAGAERGLANQVPETVFLARAARELGAEAASAFGAGFGGSVWALVKGAEADAFGERWAERYRGSFPQRAGRAEFFATAAGPASVEMYL